ncbi:pyridoxal-phosphate dependent enzyme [Streptomyces triticagri]|uniref:Pyridoxal-phosphate dependent enzyme n=1 Tax=Streptomyces triticagri TaxID=2293568 RepID=A0A372M7A5_9ACTN|nr:threonine synthase [Streptomyces triticagri]RFU86822.1 pyridoxal-phosphate dependent enzyme [Streptomyces triticagri]
MSALPDCVCPADGTRVRTSLEWCCPVCRGPLDLDHHPTPTPLKSLAGRVDSLWRYAECLPLGSPTVSLGEGRTPLVPLAGNVSAKLDFLQPTLSFKDRGAVLLAELALRLGPDRVVADSTGNAGTAVAAYCARAGLPVTVFVPGGTSPKKLTKMRAHGARVAEVDGDREAAAAAAREAADEAGTFYASHVFNPYFLHGTKTYVHELWEDLGGRLPEVLVVPVGNGTLLLGAALALRELHGAGLIGRMPALYAVQAEAVSPIATAWRAGARDLGEPASGAPTSADGIAIARPPRARQILSTVREFGGDVLTVTDPEIEAAQRDLAERGLYVEPTATACWAAVRGSERWGSRSLVVPLCGANA